MFRRVYCVDRMAPPSKCRSSNIIHYVALVLHIISGSPGFLASTT